MLAVRRRPVVLRHCSVCGELHTWQLPPNSQWYLGDGPARAQRVSTEHADRSLGPMLEQNLWVWYFLQIAEKEGFLGWGGGVLLDFVLFNLCAVCMNKLLSVYKEPGPGGAITLSDPSLSWIIPATPVARCLSWLGRVPARGGTAKSLAFCSSTT